MEPRTRRKNAGARGLQGTRKGQGLRAIRRWSFGAARLSNSRGSIRAWSSSRQIGREHSALPELILGRDEGVHVRIPDEGVSKARPYRALLGRRTAGPAHTHSGPGQHQWDAGQRRACGKRRSAWKGTKSACDTVLKFVLQDALDARFHREVHNRIAYDQLTDFSPGVLVCGDRDRVEAM